MAHITFLQIFKYSNALGNVASKQNVGVIVTDQRSSRAPKFFCIFSDLKLVNFQKPRQGVLQNIRLYFSNTKTLLM